MPIRQKRSLTPNSIPTTASLVIGELAMNIPDGRIFFRKSGSGSDTVQSAITTGTSNSGSVVLTGSLSVFNTTGNAIEISGDIMEFTGSFRITGSEAITGSLNITSGTLRIQGSGSTLLNVTGSAGELLRVVDSGSSFPILAAFSSGSTNILTVTTSSIIVTGSVHVESGSLILDAINDPAATTAGLLAVYAKDIGGRILPKWIGPSGVDVPIQPNIAFNNLSYIVPGGGSTIDTFGCTVTTVGTVTNPPLSSTNLKTQTRRFALTSGTTAGNSGSVRVSNLECWRGNAAGLGGFYVTARFGFSGSLQTGMRAFVGLIDTTGSLALINPVTDNTLAKIGMAITASTGTNWFLINNTSGSTPTATSLGAGFPVDTTTLYELILYSVPSGSAVSYRITNMSSSLQVSGSLTTNLPSATTFLGRYGWVTNNATAAAVALEISRFSLETDY